MKTILEFNLPEETEELDSALNGPKYKSILIELDNHLRDTLKHQELTEYEYDIYDKVRSKIYELTEDENIALY